MWVSFIPMLLVATSYYYLNRADPDCGTTFSWGAKAFGPVTGWLGGWAIVIADVVVMANLAQIAGSYTFLLVGQEDLAASTTWVTIVGVLWIALMTWICYLGIELSAKSQSLLLATECLILVIFAIVALINVYSGLHGSVEPEFAGSIPSTPRHHAPDLGILARDLHLLGLGLAASRSTRSPENPAEGPGARRGALDRAAGPDLHARLDAAQADHGTHFLAANQHDVLSPLGNGVFGSGVLQKFLLFSVLTSASASTARRRSCRPPRTTLSMAAGARCRRRSRASTPRFQTPSYSTV